MHPDEISDDKNKIRLATSCGFNWRFKHCLSNINFLYFGVSQCLICLSVAIDPGVTELHLILYFPNSLANDLVNPITAYLAVS